MVFAALLSCLFADLKSSTGEIGFDADNDGRFEALINSTGFGVGT